MILSNREAPALIAQERIGLDPCPPANDKRWSPTTVDLTLADEITPWEPLDAGGAETIIKPASKDFDVDQIIARHTKVVGYLNGYVLLPGKFVLGWTAERVWLPYRSRIAARVEGKSSLARIGVGVHVTAPFIHPGFGDAKPGARRRGSPIRLEIWNVGPLKVELRKGMPICQLLFEEVHGTPFQDYAGQFQTQGPGAPGGRRPRRG
jgi:dCTP deaminase